MSGRTAKAMRPGGGPRAPVKSSSSFLFEKFTVIIVEMSGWNLEKLHFFSLHSYKKYPKTTQDNSIHLDRQELSLFSSQKKKEF